MSRYRAEFLPNGLLSIWDYACQWQLTYQKDGSGKWQPHNLNAVIPANRRVLELLNNGGFRPLSLWCLATCARGGRACNWLANSKLQLSLILRKKGLTYRAAWCRIYVLWKLRLESQFFLLSLDLTRLRKMFLTANKNTKKSLTLTTEPVILIPWTIEKG